MLEVDNVLAVYPQQHMEAIGKAGARRVDRPHLSEWRGKGPALYRH
jgi:hypothetical protein